MLDKYIGDAVMAIFGAPIPRPDHAKIACLTALEVQRVLAEHYAGTSNHWGARIETRIGLHSGRMIVGNIGHTNRLDYTAIGDTVNLASRLEGVNKVFGTRIIISEDTFRQAGDAIEARELDLLRVKGKQIPIRIYELLGERGSLSRQTEDKKRVFEEALSLYRARDITSGLKLFREILAVDPSDAPARAYIERCEMMEKEELPEDWDGIFTLKTK
jgi:adenylate cyclase